MWPVSLTRQLSLSLTLLTVVASVAVAQMNPNHLRQHRNDSAQGASIDEAVKQLSSADPDKRLEAVKALSMSKDHAATAALIKAVGDPDARVQAKAIQILGDQRASESTEPLVECLIMRTTNARMEQLIIAALGKIGDLRAAQPLMEFLRRNLDTDTKGTAIFALGEIGAPEAVDVLEHIAQTDENPTIRRVASEARSKITAHHGPIRGADSAEGFLKPQGPSPAHQDSPHQH